jgi:hypothetical protein
MEVESKAAEYGRIPDAERDFKIPRARLNELADNGLIRLVRLGPRQTLVDYESLRQYLGGLPSFRPSES